MEQRGGRNVTDGLGVQLLPAVVIGLDIGERLKKVFKKTEVREEEKTKTVKKEATAPPTIMSPLKVERTIATEDADKAREDLRTLNVEKEIVSYALTRLYEAEAEGKITKDERISLVNKYKDEMKSLDTQIDRKQMIVKLHDLEGVQTELVKMFHEKLGEINKNIEDIRSTIGVVAKETPKTEAPPAVNWPETVTAASKEKKIEEKPAPKVKIPPKTKAEEKIEEIQEEVLKVLERLEQMETEG